MRLAELRGRRVAIWGFGREGASVLGALRRTGHPDPITVLDEQPLSYDAGAMLAECPGASASTGPAALEELGAFDVVVKSPGVSAYRPEIAEARQRGTVFTSATQIWFDENPRATVVAITGTKGKSTTASLLAHLLRATRARVELAGNIGKPLADFLGVDSGAGLWVLELSSYQVQDLVASPRLAVLLNLFPEHLNWHGSAGRYFLDKLNLFRHVAPGSAIVNRDDPVTHDFLGRFRQPVFFNDPGGLHRRDGAVWDGVRELVARGTLPLPGGHNLSNLCAALTALRELGLELTDAVSSLGSVQGLAHRLLVLGERDGVTWVDDSISTIPESAIAALETFAGRPISILLGGHDRGVDVQGLGRQLVAQRVHAVIALPESGERVVAAVRQAIGGQGAAAAPLVFEVADLADAVAVARRETPRGGVVLLSPAAASYGAFRDFRDRGREFARLAGFGG